MIKLLDGEKVYLPIKEIEKLGVSKAEIEAFASPRLFEDYGEAITENELNAILAQNESAKRANHGLLEITRVRSLSARMEAKRSMLPFKVALSGGDLSNREQVEQSFRRLEAIDYRKTIKELDLPDETIESYNEEVRIARETMKAAEAVLKKAGLTFQFVTEITEEKVRLSSYVAGKGFFSGTDFESDDWANAYITPQGELAYYSAFSGEDKIIDLRLSGRDFSEYGVFENIWWCLTNIPQTCEMLNLLQSTDKWVNISCDMELAAKFLNKRSFPEYLYLEGILDLK